MLHVLYICYVTHETPLTCVSLLLQVPPISPASGDGCTQTKHMTYPNNNYITPAKM